MRKCLTKQREQVKTKDTKIQSGLYNRIERIKIFNFFKSIFKALSLFHKFVRYLETLASKEKKFNTLKFNQTRFVTTLYTIL